MKLNNHHSSQPKSRRSSWGILGLVILAITTTASLITSTQAATTLRISTPQLTPESRIELIFDRAVISDKQLKQPLPNNLLTIKPSLPGKLIWKSANIATFQPSAAPMMGITYQFKIAKGNSFRNGKPIPAIQLRSIQSEPFRVIGSSRRSESISNTRQPSYYVYFNDSINAEKAAKFITFKSKGGQRIASNVRRATWGDIKSRYRRGQTWQDRFLSATSGYKTDYSEEPNAPIPNAIMVTPIAPLPVADGWSLFISKELTNAANNAVHLKGHDIWIGDVDPFELENAKAFIAANKPREIHLTFSSPLPEKLTSAQLAKLITVKPSLSQAKFKAVGKMIFISGNLRQHNQWEVTLDRSLTSQNGLPLSLVTPQKLKFKNLESALALPSFDSAQYAHGNRLYGIETVNIDSVHIRVKQLDPDKAVRTMQAYQHYKGRGHNNKNLNPRFPMPYTLIDGKTVYDRTIKLDNKIDTSRDITINWNEVLPNKDLTTTFFITVEGKGKTGAPGDNRIAQSFVQLTDIGLCWKLTKKEALIYAFSNQTGQPLANVTLQVFNDDAQKANSVTTDSKGLATLPRSDKARHLRATLGSDCYIIPFDRTLDTVALWRFPVNVEWNHLDGWKRTVMMFTDRDLYRPGETVQLKGIVRQYLDNQIELTPGKSAQLIISDSASRVLYDDTITLSDTGTFNHTLHLPKETVGRFTAKLVFPLDPSRKDKNSWLVNRYRNFKHTFNVQEFRRNAYEITSNIPQAEPGATHITLNLGAKYYQGQPVKEGLVVWNFNATQTGFYPDAFRDFLFGDHRRYDPYYWSHYFGYGNGYGSRKKTDRNGTSKLDVNGKVSISYELPQLTFPTALKVNIFSEISDSRDQTLSKRTYTTVHPADTYVGISRIDQLIRVGESPKLKLIAVDTHGKLRTNPVDVTITIDREYHETVKIQSPDRKVSVKNNKKIEQVSELQLTIAPNQRGVLPFTPQHAGRHIITIKGTDQDGHDFSTATTLRVYGSDEYPWALEDGMKIKLVPEKKQYKPGDTARILVMTPIEGTAIVTLERSGVHRVFHRELKANNPVIEIPLTDMDAPNAFVSVIIIRGANASPRKDKEPVLKLGYCTLNVENVKDRLAVDLQIEGSQHRPSEPTTITGTVTLSDGSPAASAEVVLYAEDEGTLAVGGYSNPDPMRLFYAPRPLLVDCGTSFSTFISENLKERWFTNKGFTIGGGDGSPIGIGMKLKTRTDFNPCAVWLPTVKTDAQGKFSATFTNPDTLTRYRVIAVALHGQTKFGRAVTNYTVDKPIMLEPAAPRYASQGDHLYPKVLVQNNSTFEGTWEISLATTSITQSTVNPSIPIAPKTITLQPNGAATVYFDVTFAGTGETNWVWTAKPINIINHPNLSPAQARDLSDQAKTTFKVTYPIPLMRQVQFVTLNHPGESDLLKSLDPKLLEGQGYIDLNISNSLLNEAAGAVNFLLHYPYGCVEQTTSSMMPWFALRDLKSSLPGVEKKSEAEIKKAIQMGVDRLLTMQTRDGGLAYWPGGKKAETWASAYGGMALLLAKKQGADVPDAAINQLTQWISKHLKSDVNTKSYRWNESWELETRIRGLYVLALAGKPEVAVQNKLLDHMNLLNPSARAFLALAIHHTGGEKASCLKLLTAPPARSNDNHWMRHSANKAMLVLAWAEIFPEDNRSHVAMKKLIAQRNPYGHWRTTWCNAWALQAMARYSKNVEKNLLPTTIQLVTNQVTKTITLDKKTPTHSIRIPLEEGMKMVVANNALCHINVSLSSKPKIAPTGPWASSGLAIVRRYEQLLPDGSSQPMDQPHVGDLIKVSLDITFPAALDYVVIEDRLPSLFEAINSDFKSQSSRFKTNSDHSWSITHKELRSDRAVFFLNRSWGKGTRTISYLARVTSAGVATAPAAKVEAMYDPNRLALSASKSMTTLKKGAVVGK